MKTIRDLFVHELVDLRNAAQAFHGVLQRMASVATHPEVRSLLEAYFYQSEYQEKNLRSYLTEQAVVGEEKCSVAQALCEHALESIRFDGSAEIRDVALLVSANRIQHFEITALGTALSHAELLELEEEIDLVTSLQNKIAEDVSEPVKLIANRLSEVDGEQEVYAFLGELLQAQRSDARILLDWMPRLDAHISTELLKEAFATYKDRQEQILAQLNVLSRDFPQGIERKSWEVMPGFTQEWVEDLKGSYIGILQDVGIIMTMQRIQHQNIALYEVEERLAEQLGLSEVKDSFSEAVVWETSSDESFIALTEGSFFQEGLYSDLQG